MGFMQRLDENGDGRIILTELMKMALALGIDTICEGVETEDQVRFLQEIGCSRLQGYFFSKPKPFLEAIKYHRMHKQEGYENPEESAYYELVGSVNLYDVGVIASDEKSSLKNTYNTLPMCIIEVRGDSTRFVRANQSYRDFFMRFFGLDLSKLGPEFVKYNNAFMENVVRTCCEQGVRTFYDEKMADGSVVHSFARRIGINAVTGTTAIAIAVLSIREPNEKLMIEQILSVIESFGESMPGGFFIYRADENEELIYANKAVCDIFGCESLEEFKDLTGFTFRGMVHPDDYERISESIENQVKESQADLDFVEYRIKRKDGSVRWIDDYGHYIEYDDENSLYYVFISDITDKYEQAQSDKAMHHAVMEALTKAYDSVWLITDFEHETFELFRIDQQMEHLIPANAAVGIETFSQALAFYSKLVLEEDRQRFLYDVSAENIARNTENKLVYSVPFRRVFEDGIRYYRVEFTKLDLPNEKDCIVAGFKNVDEEIRKERMIQNSLNQRKAIIDILGRSYDSVWVINDMESQSFELFRVDKKSEHLAPSQEAAKFQRFTDGFVYYSKLLPEEDRKSFLESVTPENILKNTENEKTYSVLFRRVFEDGIRYYLAEFSRLDLESGETNIIAGFRNVDEEIRRFEANRDG
jgi:PAS domain S-box-containing protein